MRGRCRRVRCAEHYAAMVAGDQAAYGDVVSGDAPGVVLASG